MQTLKYQFSKPDFQDNKSAEDSASAMQKGAGWVGCARADRRRAICRRLHAPLPSEADDVLGQSERLALLEQRHSSSLALNHRQARCLVGHSDGKAVLGFEELQRLRGVALRRNN